MLVKKEKEAVTAAKLIDEKANPGRRGEAEGPQGKDRPIPRSRRPAIDDSKRSLPGWYTLDARRRFLVG